MLVRKPQGRWGNIKMDVKEIRHEDEEWIQLAKNKDHWSVFVNTVINLRFHKHMGISRPAEQL
jgi:hypothetical protein